MQLLIDLGPVAMLADRVGPEVLVHLGKELLHLGSPPGAGGAGLGVDDDGLAEQAGARQRHEAEERTRGIAAGARHDARFAHPRPVQLGQAVHRLREQLGRGVRGVPARVHGAVAEAKVGGEVDHPAPAPHELRHDRRGRPVRQRREHDLGGRGDLRGLGRPQRRLHDPGEEGVDVGRAPVAVLLRGEEGELDGRMPREEPQELHARVAGGAQHGHRHARRQRPARFHGRAQYATRVPRATKRPLGRRLSASSTAAACAPCGARTSCARPRADRG